jgi:hypothetical protein
MISCHATLSKPKRLQRFAFPSNEPSHPVRSTAMNSAFIVSDHVYDESGRVRAGFLRTDLEHHSLAIFQVIAWLGTMLDEHCGTLSNVTPNMLA